MTTFATVLRSGGDFNVHHVARLQSQISSNYSARHAHVCFSDVEAPGVSIPLKYDWPSWWAKMELFRPDIPDDLVFMDLDTTIVGDLAEFASLNGVHILRDVYRPKGVMSGIMHIPQSAKAEVWEAFIASPEKHIETYRGDQDFLETLWLNKAKIYQDVLPEQIVSYKADCKNDVPETANIVVFHGKPRPWEIEKVINIEGEIIQKRGRRKNRAQAVAKRRKKRDDPELMKIREARRALRSQEETAPIAKQAAVKEQPAKTEGDWISKLSDEDLAGRFELIKNRPPAHNAKRETIEAVVRASA